MFPISQMEEALPKSGREMEPSRLLPPHHLAVLKPPSVVLSFLPHWLLLCFFFFKVGINRANLTELRYEMKSFMRLNSRKLPAFNGLFTLRNGSLRWFSLMCKQCFMNSKLLVIVLKNQNNSNNKILPSMHPKESPEFCVQECPEALRICKVTGPSETRECARPQFCACFSQDLVSSQSLFWFHCKHSHK